MPTINRSVLRALLLLLIVLSNAALSCPPDAFSKLSPRLSTYHQARQAALEKLKAWNPKISGVECLLRDGQYVIEIQLGSQRIEVKNASFSPAFSGNAFNYDVAVPVLFQNRGLNQLLVSRFLADHPELEEARLTFYSTNVGTFLKQMTGAAQVPRKPSESQPLVRALVQGIHSAQTPAAIQAMRSKIEEAILSSTPAGRIQRNIGMARIRKIVLAPDPDWEDCEVSVDFARDGETVPGEPLVYLAVGGPDSIRGENVAYKQFLADGTTKTGTGTIMDH